MMLSQIYKKNVPGSLCIARFLLFSLVLGSLLTMIAVSIPYIDFPFWKVWRRCTLAGTIISLYICARYFDGLTLDILGLKWNQNSKREFLFGIFLGVSILAIVGTIGLILGFYKIQLYPDHSKVIRTLLTFIPAALLIGLVEELIFRGYFIHHLRSISLPFALIVSNTIYATAHLKSFYLDYALAQELFGLFLFGMLLSYARIKTGSLFLGIGLHAILAYGARNSKLLLQFDSSLTWLYGTNRLVNGMIS